MIKLKASEVRFWQEVYVAVRAKEAAGLDAMSAADAAIRRLRERIEAVEPIPGRL